MLRFVSLPVVALGLTLVACAAPSASEEDSALGESALSVTPPTANMHFDCAESGSTTNPLRASLEVKGTKLTMKDAAGSASRKATFDRSYRPQGTPKVRYLLNRSQPKFTDAEFEWNMIMIQTSALSTGHGEVTVRLDAGDRSDWHYLQCEAKPSTPVMPASCRASVLEQLGEGSAQSSASQILEELEADWVLSPQGTTAHYSECGSSDFFYIVVRKSDCKVLEMESGDSDGECE